nr:u3 small nucleolar rna-associated protein 11 [Quercus suber]
MHKDRLLLAVLLTLRLYYENSRCAVKMSSMRNAVQRRNHRERAQPLERQKWGLLEKHKDYSLRAKDHNTKKRKIKQLTDKARERNEDEFYFGMLNSSSEGGRKRARREEGNGGPFYLPYDSITRTLGAL